MFSSFGHKAQGEGHHKPIRVGIISLPLLRADHKHLFVIYFVNVKFNLNQYTFHGHEKTHVNLFFHIHVDG